MQPDTLPDFAILFLSGYLPTTQDSTGWKNLLSIHGKDSP